jgi:hypothetical protein
LFRNLTTDEHIRRGKFTAKLADESLGLFDLGSINQTWSTGPSYEGFLSENMAFKKKNIGFMVMFRIGIAIARVIPHFRTNYSMGIYLIFVHSDRQTFTRVMNSFLGFSSIWKMRDIS